MKLSFSNIPLIIKNQRFKQIASLYTSMVLGIFAGIGVSVITTRLLGDKAFGDLKFVQNICSFVVVFLTFGFFYTGARMVAQRENEKRKHQIIAAMAVIGGAISLLFIILLFFGSFIEERLFHNQLGYIFRLFAPLLFIYPFEQYCENILAGDNKIYNLSFFRLGPKIAYLISCSGWHYLVMPLSLNSAFGLYLFSMAIFILFALHRLKPIFQDIKNNLLYIRKENKSYGFQVYFGSLISMASAQLGGITTGYFMDNTHVGYYSLALTATMPLAMIPATVGTTFFKEFSNMNSIPKKVINLTLVLSLSALVMFLIIIKPLILLLYSREYLAVVPLAYFTAIGAIFQGFGDFYNRFISAHGHGSELRNLSLIIGVSNIIGFTAIVYFFGVNGAAYTRLFSGFIYLALIYFIYKKLYKNA